LKFLNLAKAKEKENAKVPRKTPASKPANRPARKKPLAPKK
jgi:hypothetical protein